MTYKPYEVRVYNDGLQDWYLNGKRHREDGPAYFGATDHQEWWVNGKLHRENGPARIWEDGVKEWYLNGKLHREDGPAVIYSNGVQEWFLNGEQLTEEQFNKRTKSCVGKIVEIDGKKYKLTEV